MSAVLVACGLCGRDTTNQGTRRCDNCWELEKRIQADPVLARLILERLDGIKIVWQTAQHQTNSTARVADVLALDRSAPHRLYVKRIAPRHRCFEGRIDGELVVPSADNIDAACSRIAVIARQRFEVKS